MNRIFALAVSLVLVNAYAPAQATPLTLEDINVITGFGVMMTPALVVDGAVKVSGKVPSVGQIKELIA